MKVLTLSFSISVCCVHLSARKGISPPKSNIAIRAAKQFQAEWLSPANLPLAFKVKSCT